MSKNIDYNKEIQKIVEDSYNKFLQCTDNVHKNIGDSELLNYNILQKLFQMKKSSPNVGIGKILCIGYEGLLENIQKTKNNHFCIVVGIKSVKKLFLIDPTILPSKFIDVSSFVEGKKWIKMNDEILIFKSGSDLIRYSLNDRTDVKERDVNNFFNNLNSKFVKKEVVKVTYKMKHGKKDEITKIDVKKITKEVIIRFGKNNITLTKGRIETLNDYLK
jgi:hypothetical protein